MIISINMDKKHQIYIAKVLEKCNNLRKLIMYKWYKLFNQDFDIIEHKK